MTGFDWTGFFQVLMLMGGAWIEWRRRKDAAITKHTAELAVKTDERSKVLEGKVDVIAKQTDGMAKHMAAVAREQGKIDGFLIANRLSATADLAQNTSATSAVDQLRAMDSSGDFPPGVFDNIDEELSKLMEGLASEQKRRSTRKPDV